MKRNEERVLAHLLAKEVTDEELKEVSGSSKGFHVSYSYENWSVVVDW